MVAHVTIDSPAVAYGIGLFETMLVIEGCVVQLDAHRARMIASADELGFPAVDAREFEDAVDDAIRGDERRIFAVRCWYVPARRDLDDPQNWILEAASASIPEATVKRKRDGRAITLGRDYVRSLPRHKLTSYAVCTIGLRHAISRGADEALFVDAQGDVLEGTSTNVFAVDGTTLITAPVTGGVLPGVVRQWVIEQALARGLSVEERAPSIAELRRGAFFTGSLTGIAPIRCIDDVDCAPPGDVVHAIADLYTELCRH